MDYQQFKEYVFAAAKNRNVDLYELYYAESSATEMGAFQDEIQSFSSSENASVCLRLVVGSHIGYASTSLFELEEAESLVERAMENALSLEKDEVPLFCEGGLCYEKVTEDVIEDCSMAEMTEITKSALRACLAADERISDASQSTTVIEHERICIDNSNGVHLSHSSHLGAVIAQVVASDGKESASGWEFALGDLKTCDFEALAKKVSGKATAQLGAMVPESGTYSVVFAPDAMKSMLGVFGAAFSAENAQNGLSLMKDQEGNVIASSCVTLLDNPFYEKSLHKCPFDAEGVPTRSKAVVENGVLRTLLHNMATAKKAGVASTGNASKAGVNSPIAVRPRLMYFAPGENSPEELYAMAGDGFLITSVEGLHAGADYITGDFSLQANGFYLNQGKKGNPVKAFTVAGNFYDLLKKIEAVGSDLETGLSVYGSPSILVKEIMVGGR